MKTLRKVPGYFVSPLHCRGFTLVEMMVALIIMAVVSVLAWRAFDGVLLMEARSKNDFLAQNRLHLAATTLINDLVHLRPRPVRDQLGGQKGAYLAPAGDLAFEFTRGGLPDFDTMRGGIQRVGYGVEDGALIRRIWAVADLGPDTEIVDQVLVQGVDAIEVEQLDGNGDFMLDWPPLNQRVTLDTLPLAVRVTLVLEGGERWPILMPGLDSIGRGVGAVSGESND